MSCGVGARIPPKYERVFRMNVGNNKPFPEFGEYFLKYNEASEKFYGASLDQAQAIKAPTCTRMEKRSRLACDRRIALVARRPIYDQGPFPTMRTRMRLQR